MLDQLTIESFEPHVGESFFAEFPNDTKVELRLVQVAKVMESEAAQLKRHPFSLYFIGPKSYLLKQHVYTVTHEKFEPMQIFMVPVGEQNDVYVYEVVFT